MGKTSFTIADCFSFIRNGANIKQDKEKRGYPITRIETTSNSIFNRDKVGYAGIEDITPYQDYVLEDGDLLMSHINSLPYLGRVVYYDRKQNEVIIHGMNLLRLKAIRTRLRPRYATFLFSAIRFKNKIYAIAKKSVNQASFSINDLKKIIIELPTVEQQDHIVNKLVGIQKIIKLRQAQLAKLDELVKCRFVELFGDPIINNKQWEKISLSSIAAVGSSKRIFESEYVTQGIPFYRTKEIVELSKGKSISTELHITKERFDEIKKRFGAPSKNDLLVTAVGTIGTIWIVDADRDFYFKDGNLVIIKASPLFDSVFMKFLLEEIIAYRKKSLSAGTAYAALTIDALKKEQIIYPEIERQQSFSSFVSRIDKLRFDIQKSLNETQKLFDSLMQEYFD